MPTLLSNKLLLFQEQTVESEEKKYSFLKNNLSFISYISNINSNLIDNAVKINAVITKCNLIECCKNYSKTLLNYYSDK